ncbi:MAG: ABC transporter substrate-binding protein [Actinomycetota bacterium]|nr:ABC transporter substrate-binding protein [Actinomycetota bacterium]
MIATLALVTLLAGACGTGGERPAAEPPARADAEVEVLRLAGGDFGYPSPFAWVRGPGWIQAGYVFDTLIWQDSSGGFIPWLATDWQGSADAREWRFTLHPEARWHDGQPVTADDVVFTWRYMTEGPGAQAAGFAARGLDVVQEVVAEGEREVVFRLARPFAAFEESVAASVLIVPQHIWADIADPAKERGPQATMGSGPYKLEEADPAMGTYLYTAHDQFYLGAPVVKRLEFVPAQDELLALRRGDVHAAEVGLEESIPQEQLTALEQDPAFGRISADGDWNLALHFNLAKGFPYNDVRFRHAVAYAIDRQDLVDRILFGRGKVGSTGGLAPAHPFTIQGLPDYAHNPAEARRLLDELGLVDRNGDRFRDLPDGSPWVQELKASNRFSPKTPELIGEYLRAVGINTRVVMLDRAAADEAGVQGDYTMQLHGYGGIMGDPDSLRTRFSSQVRSRSFNRAHGYANERFDQLAQQQLSTIDESRRRDLLAQMQRIIAEDLPVLPLYVPDRILFFDRNVFTNWYYTPGCSPCRGSRNKHMYVTGQKIGFEEGARR